MPTSFPLSLTLSAAFLTKMIQIYHKVIGSNVYSFSIQTQNTLIKKILKNFVSKKIIVFLSEMEQPFLETKSFHL